MAVYGLSMFTIDSIVLWAWSCMMMMWLLFNEFDIAQRQQLNRSLPFTWPSGRRLAPLDELCFSFHPLATYSENTLGITFGISNCLLKVLPVFYTTFSLNNSSTAHTTVSLRTIIFDFRRGMRNSWLHSIFTALLAPAANGIY